MLGWNGMIRFGALTLKIHDMAVALFLGIAWVSALYFRGTDTIWFAPPITLIFAVLSAAIVLSMGAGTVTIPRTATALSLVLFWAYLIFAAFWSHVPYISFLFTLVLGSLPLIIFALILMPDRKPVLATTLGVFLVIDLALAVWALVQYFFFLGQYGPRIHNPFLDPNNFSVVLYIGFLMLAGFVMTASSRKWVVVGACLMALFFTAILTTHSRGAMIVIAIALATMLVLLRNPLKIRALRAAIVAATITLPILFLSALNAVRGGRSLSTLVEVSGHTVSDRILQWKSALMMIADHPFMGTGLGAFYYFYPLYRSRDDLSDGFFCHMDALQISAETGILAGILFYTLAVCIVARTVRALRVVQDPVQAAWIVTPFATALAVVLHSHIYFHLYMMAILIPLAVTLAVWYAATENALGDERIKIAVTPDRAKRSALIAAVIIVALIPVQWVSRLAISVDSISQAARLIGRNDLASADHVLDRAEAVGPRSYFHAPQYRVRLIIKYWQDGGASFPRDAKQRMFDRAMGLLDEAIRQNSQFLSMGTERADLLMMAQRDGLVTDGYERAAASLQLALEQNPMNYQARFVLSDVYRRQGELQRALAVMEDGLKWTRPKGQPDVNFVVAVALLNRQVGNEDRYELLINEAAARARLYGMTSSQ